jgi:hypothetical protein
MNLESVRGSEAWQRFMQTAQAAKERNAGLNVTAAPKRSLNNKPLNHYESVLPAALLKRGLYSSEQVTTMEKVRILGTKFDSYA